MKKLVIIFLFLAGIFPVTAQIHEIGVFVGGSNAIADIGTSYYALPNKFAFGGVYKWNLHHRLSFRLQLIETKLWANDANSDIEGKRGREFSFTNKLSEKSAGLELNFLKFDTDKILDKIVTPYIFTGVVFLNYDELTIDKRLVNRPLEAKTTSRRKNAWALPIALGVKAKLLNRFVFAAEVGTRFTFTNSLDASYTGNAETTFGSQSKNDWYTFSGLTVTYLFGRKACYCK